MCSWNLWRVAIILKTCSSHDDCEQQKLIALKKTSSRNGQHSSSANGVYGLRDVWRHSYAVGCSYKLWRCPFSLQSSFLTNFGGSYCPLSTIHLLTMLSVFISQDRTPQDSMRDLQILTNLINHFFPSLCQKWKRRWYLYIPLVHAHTFCHVLRSVSKKSASA